MKRTTSILTLLVLALAFVPSAQADFGLKDFSVGFENEDGSPATQAGSHPYAQITTFDVNTKIDPESGEVPDRDINALRLSFPPGFTGAPVAVPRCATADFLNVDVNLLNDCPDTAAIGVAWVQVLNPGAIFPSPVYNLVPPPGVAAKIGFVTYPKIPVTVEIGVNGEAPHNVQAGLLNIPQIVRFYGSATELWGIPAAHVHDPYRGNCMKRVTVLQYGEVESIGVCDTGAQEAPFLTLPRSCTGPLTTSYEVTSWQEPNAAPVKGSSQSPGMSGCSKLGFSPTIGSKATTSQAESGSGLDFRVEFKDEGLTNPSGLAQSDIRKAVVSLPEGMTVNPSVAEGLDVCTPAQLQRETLKSAPGEGCPNASKLGTVQVETPLVEEAIDGAVFQAQQDDPATGTPGSENPFDSLLALHIVLKNPTLGALVKLPARIDPDPVTGQLVTTLDNNPQVPFSAFAFHFREGARSPLITPPACGSYETKAVFTPWAEPGNPLTTTASFEIDSGVGGGPCPPGGVPPFKPSFEAGALNNNAGSFSPFNMRLIRQDGEQNMTKFSSILPPGQIGSLKGVGKCPDGAVEAAKAKTGRQELASPSCPVDSRIGRTLAGAGVGGALTYVPGQIYLSGPYKGAPLSVVSITPAVAGPFDAGTVAVRLGLDLNPKTAEVEVDGAASDPIPHILKGIVLKLRDLRVYVDRPNFTLNPTSCEEMSTKATLFGSFLDVFNPQDDVPVDLSSRYQAANCLNLGFKPRLAFKLKGGTKRGGHPALTATYRPREGDANLKALVVRLPRSAFLDQGHIRTICTRVQFAADACPKAAQYGYIKAFTPLLDEPLQGPVWLRSSDNNLPDLVFDLHGLVDVEVATRIDSARGGIRATLPQAPDAPLSKVVLQMQGARKGLIINSRDLCSRPSRAEVAMRGHNGRRFSSRPVMRATGCRR